MNTDHIGAARHIFNLLDGLPPLSFSSSVRLAPLCWSLFSLLRCPSRRGTFFRPQRGGTHALWSSRWTAGFRLVLLTSFATIRCCTAWWRRQIRACMRWFPACWRLVGIPTPRTRMAAHRCCTLASRGVWTPCAQWCLREARLPLWTWTAGWPLITRLGQRTHTRGRCLSGWQPVPRWTGGENHRNTTTPCMPLKGHRWNQASRRVFARLSKVPWQRSGGGPRCEPRLWAQRRRLGQFEKVSPARPSMNRMKFRLLLVIKIVASLLYNSGL